MIRLFADEAGRRGHRIGVNTRTRHPRLYLLAVVDRGKAGQQLSQAGVRGLSVLIDGFARSLMRTGSVWIGWSRTSVAATGPPTCARR